MAITTGDPTSVGTQGYGIGTAVGDITPTLIGTFGWVYEGEEDFYPGEAKDIIINQRYSLMARKSPFEIITNQTMEFILRK